MSSSPELSVVVVALDGGANLRRCLRALREQQDPLAMQVIVAHDGRVTNVAELRSEFPGVEFVLSPQRKNYPALRSAGVHAARGAIIAATEDQCIPPARWCANIVAEHRARSHGAIGGPVEKDKRDSVIGWAIYLREFGEYTPPMEEGSRTALTDCNVTYKRAALERIADVWRHEFHEPTVHGALRTAGEILWLSPALVTIQCRSLPFGAAMGERYRFGRLYGALRLYEIGAAKRTVLIVASPLLPFLLTARVLWRELHTGRYHSQSILMLPWLLSFSCAWAVGEIAGYISGKRPPSLNPDSAQESPISEKSK